MFFSLFDLSFLSVFSTLRILDLYSFLLDQSTYNGKQKVSNHHCQKQVPKHSYNRFWLDINIFGMIKCLLLLFKSLCQIIRETLTYRGNPLQYNLQSLFSANGNDKQHLNVNLYDGFSNESRDEKLFERNSKMTTCNSCQVKKWVGNWCT